MRKSAIYYLATVCLLGACTAPQTVFMADVDPLGWDSHSPATVVYDNADTLTPKTVSIVIRTGPSRSATTVEMEVETTTPDSLRTTESLPVTLTAKGQGFTETKTTYRTKVKLAKPGPYTFRIKPADETQSLEGVVAAGIEIK